MGQFTDQELKAWKDNTTRKCQGQDSSTDLFICLFSSEIMSLSNMIILVDFDRSSVLGCKVEQFLAPLSL